jgi:TPR repeat protein
MDKEYYTRALAAQREGDWQLAFQIVQEGAFRGSGMCMWWLGKCYEQDYWVGEQSFLQAMRWYEKAVGVGNLRAMAWFIKADNREILNVKPKDAEIWRQAITDGDDEYAKAYGSYNADLSSCEKGDCFSRDLVANACFWGRQQDQDIDRALKIYKELATEEGFAIAYGQIGYCYALGRGYERNVDQAIFYYRKAAEQKNDASMFNLAQLHAEQENYAASRYWFKKSFNKYETDQKKRFLLKYRRYLKSVGHCQKGCMTLLAIRRFRPSILSIIPKDVVRMIARRLWEMRDTYDNDDNVKTHTKKIKFTF